MNWIDLSARFTDVRHVRLSGPDALPHPVQLSPLTFTVNPPTIGWNGVRISHFPDFEAEDVAWFQSHSEVCDDNIVEQPLHGIEPVGKPL